MPVKTTTNTPTKLEFKAGKEQGFTELEFEVPRPDKGNLDIYMTKKGEKIKLYLNAEGRRTIQTWMAALPNQP